jgi:hypothetical protein
LAWHAAKAFAQPELTAHTWQSAHAPASSQLRGPVLLVTVTTAADELAMELDVPRPPPEPGALVALEEMSPPAPPTFALGYPPVPPEPGVPSDASLGDAHAARPSNAATKHALLLIANLPGGHTNRPARNGLPRRRRAQNGPELTVTYEEARMPKARAHRSQEFDDGFDVHFDNETRETQGVAQPSRSVAGERQREAHRHLRDAVESAEPTSVHGANAVTNIAVRNVGSTSGVASRLLRSVVARVCLLLFSGL